MQILRQKCVFVTNSTIYCKIFYSIEICMDENAYWKWANKLRLWAEVQIICDLIFDSERNGYWMTTIVRRKPKYLTKV